MELKLDVFNVFNHPLYTQYNGNDTLNVLPVSAVPNCTNCLSAVSGHYIGSGGQVLHIQNLRNGNVDSNFAKPIFGLIGDPTTTDPSTLARILQVAVRLRW